MEQKPCSQNFKQYCSPGFKLTECMSVLENAVHLLNREDIQLGKICGKPEKKISNSPGKVVFSELMFTALENSIDKRWHVLCFGQGDWTARTDTTLLFPFISILLLQVTVPQFPTARLGCHILKDFMDSENYMIIIKYFSASGSCWNYQDYSY